MESLDARIVPALCTWTGAVSTAFDTAANWAGWAVPQAGDDISFLPRAVAGGDDGPPTYVSVNCTGMHGPSSGAYHSVTLEAGYTGTVTLASGFTTVNLNLYGDAAISQPSSGTDITVTGNFNWTKGSLGESSPGATTPSNQNVNINGSGTITLPTNGTLYCGSTLNFNNPTAAAVETVISGLGNFFQNGGDGIYVTANASVKSIVENGAENGINSANKTLTLTLGGKWGFVGTGTSNFSYRVINTSGKFYLGAEDPNAANLPAGLGQVMVTMPSGDVNTPSYSQSSGTWLFPSTLQIQSGCRLVVPNTVQIDGGQVWVVGNRDLAKSQQTGGVVGTFNMTGGSIGFLTPIQASDGEAWQAFAVLGDVNWSGGSFVPGLNCRAGAPLGQGNMWLVSGTMNIITTETSQPTINPAPQFGQPAAGKKWDLIVAVDQGKIVGGNPTVTGWTLGADYAQNGTDRKVLRITK